MYVGDCDVFEYKLSSRLVTWYDGEQFCKAVYGGNLAFKTIKDLESRVNITSQFEKKGLFWIGATDVHDEGTWKWMDGSEAVADEIHWGYKQPNDRCNREHCAIMPSWGTRKAYDVDCKRWAQALCEIPLCNKNTGSMNEDGIKGRFWYFK